MGGESSQIVDSILEIIAGCALVGAALVFGPVSCRFGATAGATRSARLEWERREAEIDVAIADASATARADESMSAPQAAAPDGGETHGP
jgi:hypothetical protein